MAGWGTGEPVSDNPFIPPTSALETSVDANEVPEQVSKKIRNAFYAGIFSGSITLLFVLIALAGSPMAGISAWAFLDVVLIYGLAFGIYKKSRTAATVMFVYFVASKIYMMGSGMSGMVMAVVFGVFYFQGILGTFAYHKHQKELLANA